MGAHPWPAYLLPAAGIAAAGVFYAAGLRGLPNRELRARPKLRHKIGFYGGLAALTVALFPPVDRLAHLMFSAHMVQHLVLVVVAAPLLVYGRPALPFAVAAPPALRRCTNRALSSAVGRRLKRWLASAVLAGLLHAGVLWVWHVPGPYQAAIASAPVHAVEHVSFIAAAVLFWALAIAGGHGRRLGYIPATVLVLATALQSGALGAILSFATYQLYPVHSAGDAAWGLTALQDQQLAGAIMWIPAGGVYLLTMVLLMARALTEMEQRSVAETGPALHAGGRR